MIKQATTEEILRAAALLKAGDLVAFPTETVFGLGADARNEAAVEKIYALKNRPRTKPFSIMVHNIEQAQQIAEFDARALTVAHTMWPGPVSMVLKLRDGHGIAPNALAGLDTVSIRMPSHPVALALLRAFEQPMAVPSANPSGTLSTTTALDVACEFGAAGPLILADATPAIGIESTVLDLTVTPAKILRLGVIGLSEIEALVGDVVYVDNDPRQNAGLKLRTPIRLGAVDVKQGEALLAFGNMNYIGAENIGFARDMPRNMWRNLSAEGDLHQAATHLYAMLQELDQAGATQIAVMNIPNEGLGVAINDRLKRAAKKDAT